MIDPSGALAELSHQQVARPQSWSWTHLWQSHQQRVEAGAVDYCLISRVLQRSFHGFETSFEEWSLALRHDSACAVPRYPHSYRDSVDSFLGRCALHHCYFVPRATTVPTLDRYLTTEARTAANLLDVHDNGCGLPGSRAREG